MTDKEFRRLSRTDLIEIIYELQQSEKTLQRKNEDLKRQLEDRRVAIEKSGSLAEVLAKLNGLFEAAQATADSYVEETQKNRTDAQVLLEEAGRTRKQADDYLADVKRQCEDMLARTEEECRKLREEAQQGEEGPDSALCSEKEDRHDGDSEG